MEWIRERFLQFDKKAISVGSTGTVTYGEFIGKIDYWHTVLRKWDVKAGDRIGFVADYRIDVVALLQALLETYCIIIPLAEDDHSLFEERLDVACATKVISVADCEIMDENSVICQNRDKQPTSIHPLMVPLISERKSGFIIYTSGSTGNGKGVLLDYEKIVNKYKEKAGKAFRTLLFLKLDHIGGLNTLFSVVLNGGTIITSPSRQAEEICQTVEKYSVELLPTTPSFLTMLLMSNMYNNYDLSSLKVISYGTEVMPSSTLAGINRIFPDVTLKQTYGLSELGIFSTKSKDSRSNWMKVGGKGIDVKIKDDVLWIKSDQAMLGYLNAPSPFDEDGWYNTGDKVEVDGEYIRILGRESEIINVAGEKVYPAEIESYLLTIKNVKDVVVRGKRSPITGQIIWAEFVLDEEEDLTAFKKRINEECQKGFPAFKIPRLITVTSDGNFVGSRFKKIRKSMVAGSN